MKDEMLITRAGEKRYEGFLNRLLSGPLYSPSELQQLIVDSDDALRHILKNLKSFNKRYDVYLYVDSYILIINKGELEIKNLLRLVLKLPFKENKELNYIFPHTKLNTFYTSLAFYPKNLYYDVLFEASELSRLVIENLDYPKLTDNMIEDLKKSVFIQNTLDILEYEKSSQVSPWQKVSLIGLVITSIVGLIFFRKNINEIFSGDSKWICDPPKPDITSIIKKAVESLLARS